MPLIPAILTINFVSNYDGPHRVCWRAGPIGPYDCTTEVTCIGIGSPCQAYIPITIDTDVCTPTDYNGYVQATCENLVSTVGQVPFSVIYTPVCP